MPASSLTNGVPLLGDGGGGGATIDSADAFDMSLLCTVNVSSAVSSSGCAPPPSPPMPQQIEATPDADENGSDACSSASTSSDGQQRSAAAVALHVELKMRNAEIQSAHDLLQHAHRLKEEECDSLRGEVNAVTGERDAAYLRIRELRKVLRQFKSNATEFSMQRARLRVEVERLQEENDRIKRNSREAVVERDQLRESVGAFVSSLGHLKTMTEELTRERDDLKDTLERQEGSQKCSTILEDPARQDGHQSSWIERSFRLPAHFCQEAEAGIKIPLDGSSSGDTFQTSCSRLSCDAGEDETGERKLSKAQGWLSFRWGDQKSEDDDKSTVIPDDDSENEVESCACVDPVEESQHPNEIYPNEIHSAETCSDHHNTTTASAAETKVDTVVVNTSQESNINEAVQDDLAKRDLPRSASLTCLSVLVNKSADDSHSSGGFHSSWSPEPSSKCTFSTHQRRKLPRSRSAKEKRSISVRSLFGKGEPSQPTTDRAGDTCIILREGAFESSAAVPSSQDARPGGERRFGWPFRHGKHETGEAGDVDEGDCNAIIQQKDQHSTVVDEGSSGKAWSTSLWGGQTAEQRKGVESVILRRRSNGDLSLGSTVTNK